MEYFLSIIQSLYTDEIIRSVYTYGITDGIFRIKKNGLFADLEVFASDFIDGLTKGFKSGDLYSDVTDSPSDLPTESLRNSNRDLHTVKWLIHRPNCR